MNLEVYIYILCCNKMCILFKIEKGKLLNQDMYLKILKYLEFYKLDGPNHIVKGIADLGIELILKKH